MNAPSFSRIIRCLAFLLITAAISICEAQPPRIDEPATPTVSNPPPLPTYDDLSAGRKFDWVVLKDDTILVVLPVEPRPDTLQKIAAERKALDEVKGTAAEDSAEQNNRREELKWLNVVALAEPGTTYKVPVNSIRQIVTFEELVQRRAGQLAADGEAILGPYLQDEWENMDVVRKAYNALRTFERVADVIETAEREGHLEEARRLKDQLQFAQLAIVLQKKAILEQRDELAATLSRIPKSKEREEERKKYLRTIEQLNRVLAIEILTPDQSFVNSSNARVADLLQAEILSVEQELVEAKTQLGPDHPKMEQLRRKLEILQAQRHELTAPSQRSTDIAVAADESQHRDEIEETADGVIERDALADCEMHVVGMYMPANHSQDDRVYVEVKPTGKPIVLVMTGYYGAQWHVQIDPQADVRQIIIPGYYKHEIADPKPDVPTTFLTYFPRADKQNPTFFWAYAWHTADGREMRRKLKSLTGLDVTTFQGQYQARKFVVDGKRGDVTRLAETPAEVLSRDKSDEKGLVGSLLSAPGAVSEESEQRDLQVVTPEKTVSTALARQTLTSRRTQLEHTAREIEQHCLTAAALYRAEAAQESPDAKALNQIKLTLQRQVQRAFETNSKLQEIRLQLAELDLYDVKAKHQRRKSLAGKIIERRVEELLSGDDLSWTTAQRAATSKRVAGNMPVATQPSAEQATATTPADEFASGVAAKSTTETTQPRASDLPKQTIEEQIAAWVKMARSLGDEGNVARKTAIDEITTALHSDDTGQHLAAASALAQLGDVKFDKTSYRKRLLELCGSNNGPLQVKAFYALYNTDRQDGDLALLQKMLTEPHAKELDQSASHLLMIFGDGVINNESETLLLQLLNSSESGIRREALRGIWGAKYGEAVTNRIIELVDHKESHHDAIYFALSTSPQKTPVAVDKLIEVLSDPDWNNWGRAIWGLGYGVPEDQQKKVADAMLQMYELRSDPRTRGKCEKLIRQYGDEQQIRKFDALGKNSALETAGASAPEPEVDE